MMKKFTTEDCVQEIESFLPNVSYFGDKWKRRLKIKNSQGQVERFFCAFLTSKDTCKRQETWVIVTETGDGIVCRIATNEDIEVINEKFYKVV
jgi:hypothetical protein